MCRYALRAYKPRYACFGCRKAFRRRLLREVDPTGPERPARCPDCGLLMANVGLDFRAPRRTDLEAWRVAESLFAVGITFHSCGCGGPGYRPRSARDYQVFLAHMLEEYRGTLDQWLHDTPEGTDPARRDAAVATWRERVQRVEQVLAEAGRGDP